MTNGRVAANSNNTPVFFYIVDLYRIACITSSRGRLNNAVTANTAAIMPMGMAASATVNNAWG